MFGWKSRAARELDALVDEMKINLANNYKSTAHAARIRLGERAEALYAAGSLSEQEYRRYRDIYTRYTEMLKDYHH